MTSNRRRLRWSLAKKMGLGYLPMALLITATAAFGLLSLLRVDRAMEQIVARDTPAVEKADELVSLLLAQDFYGRRYLILGSAELADAFHRRGDAFGATVEELANLDPALGPELKKLLALHRAYERAFEGASPQAETAPASDGDLRARRSETAELARKLGADLKRRREDHIRRAARTGALGLRATLALCAAGLLVGLGSAALITRNLTRAIGRLKLATEKVAAGEFEDLPAVASGDELGALSKAFAEMAAKIKDLEARSLDANALTRLPGGAAIDAELRRRLAEGTPLAFCLADLDHFKAYNDRYGYAQGSELIKALARILESAVARLGTPDDFVGHVGGDDFVLITTPERYGALCAATISRFDAAVPGYYDDEDRARGYVVGTSRHGDEVRFPLVSVSIAVVTNERRPLTNHLEVSELAAELKKYAKSLPGSVLVIDRRGREEGG